MRVWVTGAAGFVGRHVSVDLHAAGHEVIGVDLAAAPAGSEWAGWLVCDFTNAAAVRDLAQHHPADACLHLAGIAHVPEGWRRPQRVMDVNLNGTINLLEAWRVVPNPPRLLVVTSAEVYGRAARTTPIRETDPMIPSSMYGVSKLAADTVTRLYHDHYGLPAFTARPQNHIGPGQSNAFVVTAFAEQLVQLKTRPAADRILRVGNLDSARDLTDVRDVARAYRLLLERGVPGEAYNVASGHNYVIGDVLEQLCALAGYTPCIETDPDRYRPTDSSPLLSIDKIRDEVGWTPAIPLAQTLADIVAAITG